MTVIKNNAVVNRTVPAGKTTDPLALEIQRLRAENEALKASKTAEAGKATLKVAEKGGVSAYGMGRFPVTAYAFTKASIQAGSPVFEGSGWHKLIALCTNPGQAYQDSPIYKFIMANKAAIVAKQQASLAAGAAASDDSAL